MSNVKTIGLCFLIFLFFERERGVGGWGAERESNYLMTLRLGPEIMKSRVGRLTN